MKIFASIMAFVVLFLSMEPVLALMKSKQATECCGEACQKTTGEQKSSGDNNSKNNHCNPFQSCANIVCYFTVVTSQFNIKAPLFYSNVFIIFSEDFRSQFAPDFWQPPKVV